jgi:DNA mismatch endonuclease Vsr
MEAKQKYKEKRLLWTIPRKDTKIEVIMQNELTNRGISFKKHKSLHGQPDVFVEPNICVFVDGCWVHACPVHNPNGGYKPLQGSDRRNHDTNITHKLEGSGYTVLRFWGHEIEEDVGSCVNKILGL